MFLNDWNAISQLYQCVLNFSRALPGTRMDMCNEQTKRYIKKHVTMLNLSETVSFSVFSEHNKYRYATQDMTATYCDCSPPQQIYHLTWACLQRCGCTITVS